jgi:hypothetical protein
MVAVSMPYTEITLREQLKTARGRWNPEERDWRVCFDAIRGDTTLVERIVREYAAGRGTMRADRTGQVYGEQVTYIGYQLLPQGRDEATYIGD